VTNEDTRFDGEEVPDAEPVPEETEQHLLSEDAGEDEPAEGSDLRQLTGDEDAQ
jgi:hypothetical protein